MDHVKRHVCYYCWPKKTKDIAIPIFYGNIKLPETLKYGSSLRIKKREYNGSSVIYPPGPRMPVTVTTRMTWNIWIGNWRSRSLNLLHFPLLLLGLGGGRSKRNLMFRWRTFKDFWHFSPWTLGEMIQFDLCIFLNWVETTNQWSVE